MQVIPAVGGNVGLDTLSPGDTFESTGPNSLQGVFVVGQPHVSLPIPEGKIAVFKATSGELMALNPDTIVTPRSYRLVAC